MADSFLIFHLFDCLSSSATLLSEDTSSQFLLSFEDACSRLLLLIAKSSREPCPGPGMFNKQHARNKYVKAIVAEPEPLGAA
jgi:hypothetical protein